MLLDNYNKKLLYYLIYINCIQCSKYKIIIFNNINKYFINKFILLYKKKILTHNNF